MPLDTATYFGLLDLTNPRGSDSRTLADDFHRVMRESCQLQFPNLTAQVTSTHEDLNTLQGVGVAGKKVMTGDGGMTVMFVYNDTAPYGWTVTEPDANIRNLIIGPGGSGGSIGGVNDPTAATLTVSVTSLSGTTDSESSHTHGVGTYATSVGAGDFPQGTGAANISPETHTHPITGNSGSGTAHSHGVSAITGSGTADYQPRYARGRLVQLDA